MKNGVCFPETYFLLEIVYNHPLHEISENMDKPLGMKLDNIHISKNVEKSRKSEIKFADSDFY